MAEFRFQELFELGEDTTPYRKLAGDFVSRVRADGREILRVEPEALAQLATAAFDDIAHLLRPGHLAQLRKILDDPEASANDRFVALELLTNANIAAGRVLPGCQDTGTAIVIGHKGENVWTGGGDAEALSQGIFDGLSAAQPALLAARAARHVPREEHRHEPSGADRDLRRARRRVPPAVPRQGRRLGEQDLPLPGDEGAAQPGVAAALRGREDPHARHLGLSALSPGAGGRRALGGAHAQDREARERALSRRPAHARATMAGRAFRDPGARGAGLAPVQRDRDRRPVRRQVFRARRARDPAARGTALPARWGSASRARRTARSSRRSRATAIFLEQLEENPGALSARRGCERARRRRGARRPAPADARDPGAALALPGGDAALALRPPDRGPRHRAREAEGTPRCRRGSARNTSRIT